MRAGRLGIAVLGVLLSARAGAARCGDGPNDAAAMTAARTLIASSCACAASTVHADYVRCARAVAAQLELAGLLRADCVPEVKRCAARSTCGRAGALTCCVTRNGVTRCRVKRDPSRCVAPAGGSACAGSFASCCDACATGGCVAGTTTTAPVPTTTTTSSGGGTTTTTLPELLCNGGTGFPVCDGVCPPGHHCEATSVLGPFSLDCGCFPDGTTACEASGYPTCGGACLGAHACLPIKAIDGPTVTTACTCADPAAQCTVDFATCGAGIVCPPGDVCTAFLLGGGGADCGCGAP
jgi:hypothetical protein